VGQPDPGEGFRLVTDLSEYPHPGAELWLSEDAEWVKRTNPSYPYSTYNYYRVPDSNFRNYKEMQFQPPLSEPVPLRWPDIPVSDDAWFQTVPEPEGPDRTEMILVWMGAALLFATGFILGWLLL